MGGRNLGLGKRPRERKAFSAGRRNVCCPLLEILENRCQPAFLITGWNLFSGDSLRLVADFSHAVDSSTLQSADLFVDGSPKVTGIQVLDADTVEFRFPTLSAGLHTLGINQGAILDSLGNGLAPFSDSFATTVAQFTIKQSPRLQPGNAPLPGYKGSETDRVDLLWQTIPAGAGTTDTFTVEARRQDEPLWTPVQVGSPLETGVEGRAVWSATITGLAWDSDYEYRVRHLQGDVIREQFQSPFHTRLRAGDGKPFSFAAYGDSADGSAAGFRLVQSRINQLSPAFAVLLGDNVYSSGSHPESDSRFDPAINPEATRWMAGHIDYLGLGNHDVVTLGGTPTEQNYSVPIPVAGVTAPAAPPPSERPEHSFSWDYGNVHFVTFDTNSSSDPARLDGLLKWVEADLAATNATWKIVYGHHPLAGVPDKPENPGGDYYQQVVNRLKGAGVDLFMTGHSHTYAWTYPLTGQVNGNATFTDHGYTDYFHPNEGLTQLVSGVGGVAIRGGSFSEFPFVARGFTNSSAVPARYGFSKVDVSPDNLTVSYIAADTGIVLDSFVLEKEETRSVSFQQGINGYGGETDTLLREDSPNSVNGANPSLKVDGDTRAGEGLASQVLLRFQDIFGIEPGKIPAGAVLRSATLELQVTNPSNSNVNLHRMISSWSDMDTWNSSGKGIQADGKEASTTPDTSTGTSRVGKLTFNVLASLKKWQANPETNQGWVFFPTGNDGLDFDSAEGAIPPKLSVTWLQGVNQAPIVRGDSARTWGGNPVVLPVLENDRDPEDAPLEIRSFAPPSHGHLLVNNDGTFTYTPYPGFLGNDTFTYVASDGLKDADPAIVNVTVGRGPVVAAPFNLGPGSVVASLGDGRVAIRSASGDTQEINPFPGYRGPLNLSTLTRASGAFPDSLVIAVSGRSTPHVLVVDGNTGQVDLSFYAFDPGFLGGVSVSGGLSRIGGETLPVILCGAGSGSEPAVSVFDARTGGARGAFYAFSQAYKGGVRVTLSEPLGDGTSYAVVASTINSHLVVFDPGDFGSARYSFYGASGNVAPEGFNVAAGDLDRDGALEIIAGAEKPVTAKQVTLLSLDGKPRGSFAIPYPGGIRVALGDTNADGRLDILAGSGPGQPGLLSAYDPSGLILLDNLFTSGSLNGIASANNFARA